jgi:DNA-binding protein HU-beta
MATITIRQLAKTVAADTTRPKDVVEEVLKAAFQSLAASLASGDKFVHSNFGHLERRVRKAHIAPNPQTGGTVDVPEAFFVHFNATGVLREMVRDGDPTRSIRKAPAGRHAKKD